MLLNAKAELHSIPDSKLFGHAGVSCPDDTCPPLMFCFLSILLFFLFPFSLSFSVYVCMSLPVIGLVSCQVSSLLALLVSQRSDKRELGVGLSLPLATEVSFSPSIIHILFNLTR